MSSVSSSFHECSVCGAMFRTDEGLMAHLTESSRCRESLVAGSDPRDPHAFTAELESETRIKTVVYSGTVPDTVITTATSESKSGSVRSSFEDASLLKAMESGMKKKSSPAIKKKSGLEMSVLSAIAEGDTELVTAYKRLSVISGGTRGKTLTPELVSKVAKKTKIDMDRVAKLFNRAQNVSICFVLDTTGSMASYIVGVKDQIIQIVHHVESSGCGIAGLAFVGYKDWCDGEKHFEILPFTEDVMKFKKFVEGIRAGGGGDTPEDVVGGLNQAVRLSWPEGSGTRVLFHLGDAPPHGKRKYHDMDDDYPNGHPMDRPLESLFQEMKSKNILYHFGRINNHCDRMILVFETHYGGKIDRLDTSKVSTLSSHVTSSVMRSVSTTCSATLSTVKSSGATLRRYVLDPNEPNWSRIPLVDATIVTFKLPESIDVITSFTRMEDIVRKCLIQVAPNPFAKGSVRLAHYGRIIHSSKSGESPSGSASGKPPPIDEAVFKEFITLPKVAELDRQRYMVDLEVQTIASKLAFEFNDRLARTTRNPNVKLKFLMAKVIRTVPKDGSVPRFMAYEKRFRGPTPEMIKYTNNLNFVLNADTLDDAGRTRLELAIAFSHFTHSATGGYLLVCDLQGISTVDNKKKPTLLLTDPAIHCAKHLRFGKTNLGAVGMDKFFAKHACNQYCRALGLTMPSEK